ncbi:uncharacterized protein LOC131933617, partial [Physella acuta]|uniref:uncharacterized protein LOC131933617 n=1 Tax=Physella acuta TaxID=109671 RepID=UPI0027DD0FAA
MWIQSLFLVLMCFVGLRHLAQVVIYPEDPYSDVISHPDFRPTPETPCYLSVDQMIGNTSMFFTGGSVIDLDLEDESSTTLVELDMHVPNARLPYLYERKKKSRTKRKAVSRQDYRWPGGIIPYEFVTKDF